MKKIYRTRDQDLYLIDDRIRAVRAPQTRFAVTPPIDTAPMAQAQLELIYVDDDMWRLDERTIRVGRKGLAEARKALARSRRPFSADQERAAA